MKLRKIELQTADGLPPLPMQISWVRDGILVVAMDSEMHVYSQWKPNYREYIFSRKYCPFEQYTSSYIFVIAPFQNAIFCCLILSSE